MFGLLKYIAATANCLAPTSRRLRSTRLSSALERARRAYHDTTPRSSLETLPDTVLEAILRLLADTDRVALLQLARASPLLYAPAIDVAIRTASVPWYPLSSSDGDSGQRSPPLSSSAGADAIGQLGYWAQRAPDTVPRVYLIAAPAKGGSTLTSTALIGPISPKHLSTLHLNDTTGLLTKPVLPHARHVSWSVPISNDVVFTILRTLTTLGGLPACVSRFTLRLTSADMIDTFRANLVVQSLAALLAPNSKATLVPSHVQHLDLIFDDDTADINGYLALVPAIATPLTKGLPPRTLKSLTVRGFRRLRNSVWVRDEPVAVPWPVSLESVEIDVGDGGTGMYITNAIASMRNRKLPSLHTLKLAAIPIASGNVAAHVVMALKPTLTTFHLGVAAVFQENATSALHTIVAALVETCTGLRELHLGARKSESFSAADLADLARDTVPLLGALPINELGLVAWGLDAASAETAAVLDALDVPTMRSLVLRDNDKLGVTGDAVMLITPLVTRHANLLHLDMRGCRVSTNVAERLRDMAPTKIRVEIK
ncbi:hypothetical protein AMAG_05416 [Allomyces macrogynus ATCC 38327]|uniref:F-box domain-containing protein n=1 Tax=Allomyces macrogynus (strain ATCC 38327) TaxID=578462 RepID=A0A0L0SC19_ALLM3|nr:hypothetical protein AMAG_05416 [Allomyces macrogynus ATCC 38327]|eukprot:KNE59972.1 hypothetical protein AMAG_05416 [Allomyces macrogynus ATCC 38327]